MSIPRTDHVRVAVLPMAGHHRKQGVVGVVFAETLAQPAPDPIDAIRAIPPGDERQPLVHGELLVLLGNRQVKILRHHDGVDESNAFGHVPMQGQRRGNQIAGGLEVSWLRAVRWDMLHVHTISWQNRHAGECATLYLLRRLERHTRLPAFVIGTIKVMR